MNIQAFAILLLAAHFIGDWWMQPRWMAEGKSSSAGTLLHHLFRVTIWIGAAVFFGHTFFGVNMAPNIYLLKLLGNAVIHGIVDWNGWKWYKKGKSADFKYWKDKKFYDTIAGDQFLHLATLFLIFL